MIRDELFDAALLFKKSKLWKKLTDTSLFAVQHADGEVGYCSVMGYIGELIALAVYPGTVGLESLRKLTERAPNESFIVTLERMHSQDCVMLSLENKADLSPRDIEAVRSYCARKGVVLRGRYAFPNFDRFQPGYERWYLEDETDQQRMLEGIHAALEVSRRLTDEMCLPYSIGLEDGFLYERDIPLLIPTKDGFRWESHALPAPVGNDLPTLPKVDDLTKARLMKSPRRGCWAASIFRFFQPILQEEEDESTDDDALTAPPYYPYALCLISIDTGAILSMVLSRDPEDYRDTFLKAFVECAQNNGLPQELLTEDARVAKALSDLCEQLDIPLDMEEEIEALDEALDSLVETFTAEGDPIENIEAEQDEIFEMLKDPATLAQIPNELFSQVAKLAGMGMLPEDIETLIRKEAKRRRMRID